ncbi:hypothetical protein EIN_168500 [Entamoeba invadens IP1]|uniref:Uncharacterized protein n=1 Tax=Entamoeba invadens IP1 TaxID=370355 RepID=A0A0A1TY55_ENTIV|nr:hypothetical protein EIN_168500 [Entamoeba invadens IP1]ELP84465.1 hypothetical protein EIN_168500 [Entamoeba invadens IP1]|eukprot:XP_004183811.1 hypothetical protein EIN_168500 [Entamoeba invadens IP1]
MILFIHLLLLCFVKGTNYENGSPNEHITPGAISLLEEFKMNQNTFLGQIVMATMESKNDRKFKHILVKLQNIFSVDSNSRDLLDHCLKTPQCSMEKIGIWLLSTTKLDLKPVSDDIIDLCSKMNVYIKKIRGQMFTSKHKKRDQEIVVMSVLSYLNKYNTLFGNLRVHRGFEDFLPLNKAMFSMSLLIEKIAKNAILPKQGYVFKKGKKTPKPQEESDFERLHKQFKPH